MFDAADFSYKNFINLLVLCRAIENNLYLQKEKKACLTRLIGASQIYFHHYFPPLKPQKETTLIISFKGRILKKCEDTWKTLLGKNYILA